MTVSGGCWSVWVLGWWISGVAGLGLALDPDVLTFAVHVRTSRRLLQSLVPSWRRPVLYWGSGSVGLLGVLFWVVGCRGLWLRGDCLGGDSGAVLTRADSSAVQDLF